MTLRDTQLSLSVSSKYSVTKDHSLANAAYNFARAVTLSDGTGSNQVDKIFADTRTTAGNDDIDLAGALTDDLGVALTFVKVKGLFVANSSASTGNAVIGNAAATQFQGPFGAVTHTIAVPPGQWFGMTYGTTGWTVGAGASDLLRIAASAGSVTYDIYILGTSA